MAQSHNDVNLEPNWAGIYEYFVRMRSAEELEELVALVPSSLANRLRDMSRMRERKKRFPKYPDTWEPLATWNIIENALIDYLGHGFHLREVGRCSRFAGFGSDAFLAFLINNRFGRFFTSPVDGFKNVRYVAKRCVTNKDMFFVQMGPGFGYIIMMHHRDIADPFDDFWSVSSFIVGHGDSVNQFWRQSIHEDTTSTVVATSVFRVLEKYAPAAKCQKIDQQLIINDEVHGEIGFMQLHEGGFLLDGSDALISSIPGTIPVMKITRTFSTPCSVCRKDGVVVEHPLLQKGQTFQISENADHRFPNSAFRVHWKAKWIDRVKPLTSQIVVNRMLKTADTETELTDVRHELEDTRDELDAMKTVLARIMPNAFLAEQFAHGTLGTFTRDAVVLQFDIVGSTELIKRFEWTVSEQMKHIGHVVSECFRPAISAGGWDYQDLGDGGIVVFCPRWPSDKAETISSLSAIARKVERSAFDMHKIAHSYGMSLRIGIDVGPVSWQQKGSFIDGDVLAPRFAANGDPLNLAARLEQSLKDNDPPLPSHTRMSNATMELLHSKNLVKTARISGNMKLMGFEYTGIVQVKTDAIECWTRREAPKSIFEEGEFSNLEGIEDIEVLVLSRSPETNK